MKNTAADSRRISWRTYGVWLLGRLCAMGKCLLGDGVISGFFQAIANASLAVWNFIVVVFTTGDRDATALIRLFKSKYMIWKFRRNNYKVHDVFEIHVKEHPDKLCLISREKKWTFKEVDEYANRVANCFSELGFMPGEEVAIFMEACPEYGALWLGLSKIGIIPALVNTNQRLDSLVHSITSVKSKAVIFGSELLDAIRAVEGQVREKTNIRFFCLGEFDSSFPAQSLDSLLQESSTLKPVTTHKGSFNDRLFYVYTSGTTGLPKAAIITHSRFFWMALAIHNMLSIKSNDVLYTCLPLYHTASGVLAIGQVWLYGNTLAMRRKFSASKFWDDCIYFEATVTQYIGEICRYLLATPPSTLDKSHSIRLMFGNGMRKQVWVPFVERFGIKQIGELYGSTEGNANVLNIDNTVGSCGFISRISPSVYPVSLIKMNEELGEPMRSENGLCIICKPGEPGEFVGKILDHDPLRAFDGYVSKSATEKKIIHDVFRKGDCAFLSGDLLIMDSKGYLYFMDRTGDTFRWKGENVSTTEVEGTISKLIGQTDCVVYGVEIKGMEGKAGMVAIPNTTKELNLNLPELLINLKKALPAYAIPLFIRIVKEIEATGTYKLKKTDLQKEGFNPNVVHDLMYYLNPQLGYQKLDLDTYDNISSGNLRL